MSIKDETRVRKFWSNIDRSWEDECWPWKAKTTIAGYGRLRVNGVRIRAHRYAYELTNGPIPDGIIIRHTCDNPICCNPDHLVAGTHVDNVMDRVKRKRTCHGARWYAARKHLNIKKRKHLG